MADKPKYSGPDKDQWTLITMLYPTNKGGFNSRVVDADLIGEIKKAVNALTPGTRIYLNKAKSQASNGGDQFKLQISTTEFEKGRKERAESFKTQSNAANNYGEDVKFD